MYTLPVLILLFVYRPILKCIFIVSLTLFFPMLTLFFFFASTYDGLFVRKIRLLTLFFPVLTLFFVLLTLTTACLTERFVC